MSKCLMIVGMHRSGTSLIASILQKAGLYIGDELLGVSEGNKKGHFENRDFFKFQVKALKSLSLSADGWDLQSISSLDKSFDREAINIIKKNTKEEWGWKEPRTTLFLNYWKNKIPTIKYLFVYRNPWDVVDSLFRRASDQKILANPELAFKVWDFYNREIIDMYKKHKEDSIIIHIDDVIKNIPDTIKEINTQLGFHLKLENSKDVFDESMYKFSDENLLHSYQTALAFPDVINTLNELRTLSGKEPFQVKELSKNELYEKMSSLFIERWHEIGIQNQTIKKLKEEIKWMKEKNSWHFGKFWKKTKSQ